MCCAQFGYNCHFHGDVQGGMGHVVIFTRLEGFKNVITDTVWKF